MIGCTETVTIINAFTDDGGAQQYRACVLSGVSWYEDCAVTTSKAGDASGSRFICRIPQDRCGGYLPPQQWAQLADKQGRWTVQPDCYAVHGAFALPSDGFLPPESLAQSGLPWFRVLTWRDSRGAGRLGHIRIGGSLEI